jgi:hypothetical protein
MPYTIKPEDKINMVADHIRASSPCGMQGVINWCLYQGLGEYFVPCIISMSMDKEITIYSSEGDKALIIELV